jgi:hypothetical protein
VGAPPAPCGPSVDARSYARLRARRPVTPGAIMLGLADTPSALMHMELLAQTEK